MVAIGNNIPGTFPCAPTPHGRLFWPALLLAAAVFGWFIYRDMSWYWVAGICLPIFFVGCSVTWRSTVVPRENMVEERALLFDRLLITKRTKPLTEFVEIVCELMHADDSNFWVGLKHKTGRVLWIKGCGSQKRFAEELAWRVHCDTGIKLKGERT